jgi:hypothetical protein
LRRLQRCSSKEILILRRRIYGAENSNVLTPNPPASPKLRGTGSLYFVKRGLKVLDINIFPLFPPTGGERGIKGGEYMRISAFKT